MLDISYTLESSLELRAVVRPVLAKLKDVIGVRRTAITILSPLAGGVSISEAMGLPNDVGNLPVVLAFLGDEDQLVARSLEQAHLTHHHRLSDAAVTTLARLTRRLVLEGACAHAIR